MSAGTTPILMYDEVIDLPENDIIKFAENLQRITTWKDLIGQRIIAILEPFLVFEDAFVEFGNLEAISPGKDRRYGSSYKTRKRNVLGQRITSISYGLRHDAEVLHLANGEKLYVGHDVDSARLVGIVIRHTKDDYELDRSGM